MQRRTVILTHASALACGSTLLLLAACSGGADSHNLGDTAEGIQATAAPRATVMDDFKGSWIGVAEDPLAPRRAGEPAIYHFPSGASQIRFEFPEPPNSYVTTSYVTFGEGEPPPWPASLDAGYPPDVDYRANWYSTYVAPVEGFTYELGALNYDFGGFPPPAEVPDGVLHLVYLTNEAIAPWCDAQTASPTPSGYSCLGGAAAGFSIEHSGAPPIECIVDEAPVDCGKYYLCAQAANGYGGPAAGAPPPCACTEGGCQINGTLSDLFLSRDGDDLVGIFSNTGFSRAGGTFSALGQVRFHRQ